MKNRFLFAILTALLFSCTQKEDTQPIEYFDLTDVRLLNSEFKNAQELDIQYMLALEPDHFVKFENSFTGYRSDLHYREADGWFSYQMNNKDKSGKFVYLKFFDGPGKRACNISIDDEEIKYFKLDGTSGEDTLTELLPILDKTQEKSSFKLKVAASDNLRTFQLVEVRILNSKDEIIDNE